MYHIFFVSSVDERWGCFHVLPIVNSAALNTGVHMSFWIMVFSGCIPCGGIGASYGSFSFLRKLYCSLGFPGGASGKEPVCPWRRCKRFGFHPWVGKIPWRRIWQPSPVFLPGEFHRWRSLMGYNRQGHKESGRTLWMSSEMKKVFWENVYAKTEVEDSSQLSYKLCLATPKCK